MARVGRLAGAILAETNGEWFLVGNTKTPCDWAAAGFEPPIEVDAMKRPFLRLSRAGEPAIEAPVLTVGLEGEALAKRLSECFLITRNGSVSDRLWRLVVSPNDPLDDDDVPAAIDARWLGEMPIAVWNVVRDTVLRCV
jgi:hypothetical protein